MARRKEAKLHSAKMYIREAFQKENSKTQIDPGNGIYFPNVRNYFPTFTKHLEYFYRIDVV